MWSTRRIAFSRALHDRIALGRASTHTNPKRKRGKNSRKIPRLRFGLVFRLRNPFVNRSRRVRCADLPCFGLESKRSALSLRTFWLRLHARSHAPRGNAVFDAPRRLASAEMRTQSVQEGIPTQSVGTRFSHGSGWKSKKFPGSARTLRVSAVHQPVPHSGPYGRRDSRR